LPHQQTEPKLCVKDSGHDWNNLNEPNGRQFLQEVVLDTGYFGEFTFAEFQIQPFLTIVFITPCEYKKKQSRLSDCSL